MRFQAGVCRSIVTGTTEWDYGSFFMRCPMNLKALGLASAAILFSSSPMLTQARKQPIGEPKSRQQSKLAVAPIPLEIKSDRIGETIAQFTAHHPNAKCKEESVDIRTCSQRAGVSLAGLTTMGTSCDPPTSRYFDGVCGTEGLIARFSKDKLKDLTYRFYVNEAINYPQSNILEICRAFTTKYGRPDDGDGIHTCDWDMKNK